MKRVSRTIFSTLAGQHGRILSGTILTMALGSLAACSGDPDVGPGNSIDKDGDGVADDLLGTFIDTDGDKIVDSIDTNGDFQPDGRLLDTNNDGIFDAVDVDGDGLPDYKSDLGSGGASSGSGGSGTGSAPMGSGGLGTGNATGGGGGPASGGGPGSGGGGGGTEVTCVFTINGAPAMEMPTVGVVDFTATGLSGAVTGGMIEFGLDTTYGMAAPINLTEANNKTLLIGMKPNQTYNYRVRAEAGGESCVSDNQTIMSGQLRNGVAELQGSQTMVTGEVANGFIVAASGSSAIIIDKDGEVVWGYAFSAGGGGGIGGVFSAKMSWDGKYMLSRDLGPFNAGNQGKFFRVNMDGSGLTDFDVQGGDHHDFTVTPDGIAYIAKANAGEYDKIYTASYDGMNSQVVADLKPFIDAYPQGGGAGMGELAHVNAIHYWHTRQVYTVSNRESDALAMVSTSGQFLKGIGKAPSGNNMFMENFTAEGAGQSWRVQHGHDWYADDKVLVFSNGDFGGGTSRVLHYTVTGTNAAIDWEYTATGNSATQGDVKRLPNGNVLITASQAGMMHQIKPPSTKVAQYKTQGFGYTYFMPTLYGPPPEGT